MLMPERNSAHPTPNVEVKVVCGESQGSEEEGLVKGNVRPLGGCWYVLLPSSCTACLRLLAGG